jgi:CBS domain-containing protein
MTMLTVADIMTKDLVTLTPSNSLADAHTITREKGIRHLPVIDSENHKLIAIVTQKSMIARVINLVMLYGGGELRHHEKITNIMEVAEKDFETVTPSQSLHDVAPFFLANKHGCLPVVDDEQNLVGMITSSDFVHLSVSLLEQIDK